VVRRDALVERSSRSGLCVLGSALRQKNTEGGAHSFPKSELHSSEKCRDPSLGSARERLRGLRMTLSRDDCRSG
jgi:hypothetical protein